jgi:UDP-3-O-[3-hydroxymyristoyl] N-acetylglucosamine deacetylase
MYKYQTTIDRVEKFTGIGLHSGKNVTVKIVPAPVDTGIIFIREDLDNFEIEANPFNVVDTTLCTTLGKNNITIKTIEHFLSAAAAAGIDNMYVFIDSEELPIMDGSAAPFLYILKEAGIKTLHKKKKYIKIKKTLKVFCEDKQASLEPSDDFIISFHLDYNHKLINKQFYSINFSKESYLEHISRARTFGFLHEVEMLKANNLALGGSLDNAVVIDKDKVLNKDGLRYEDEFVRHKILDALGDLYLLGHPIIGHYKGIKAGHALNNRLCKKLLSHREYWEFAEAKETYSEKLHLFEELQLAFC